MSDLSPTSEIEPEAQNKQNYPRKVGPICIGLVWITISGGFFLQKTQQHMYGLPVEGTVVEIGKPTFRSLPKGQSKAITRVWVRYTIGAVNYRQQFELHSAAHLTVGSHVPLSYFAIRPDDAWIQESLLPVITFAITMFFGLAFLYVMIRK